MAQREGTGEEVSFEWSDLRISSTDSQVRTSLRESFFCPGSERVKGKINLKKKKPLVY